MGYFLIRKIARKHNSANYHETIESETFPSLFYFSSTIVLFLFKQTKRSENCLQKKFHDPTVTDVSDKLNFS
jgi:hypothetical protein